MVLFLEVKNFFTVPLIDLPIEGEDSGELAPEL
jgi:hypothetical protein